MHESLIDVQAEMTSEFHMRASTRRTFINSAAQDPTTSQHSLRLSTPETRNSSLPSTGSGVSSLTTANLRISQEQICQHTHTLLPTALRKARYTSPEYSRALVQRACVFLDLGEDKEPANYNVIKDALEAPRTNSLSLELAGKLWDTLKNATTDDIVSALITSYIINFIDMRQPDQDLWANLSAQWSNEFPLGTRDEEEFLIAAPNPDAAIGYNADTMEGTVKARRYLKELCAPVKSEKQLVFPVVTVEAKGLASELDAQYQNQHNSAVMLRNLRKLRETASMTTTDLETQFDNTAHVLTINFTKAEIVICCCWTELASNGFLEYFSKPVATMSRSDGLPAFHKMTRKIQNAIEWVTTDNKSWIWNDLMKLESQVSALPALEPLQSQAGSISAQSVTS